jgi:hypothetical protein
VDRCHRLIRYICVITTLIGVSAAGRGAASARVLMVGPGQEFAQPSDAARAVADGDEVRILAGTYYDCAVWRADHLVIAGAGAGTVMTDAACQGKANFVITGRDVTVRDLTFTRIRVNDANGAGIRSEGPDLLVERVRFDNDQAGVLAVNQPEGTIQILGCVFRNNGTITDARVPASVEVGALRRLVIRNSDFEPGRAGAAINSGADFTEIAGSRIAASPSPPGSQKGATVQVAGGLLMVDSDVQATEVMSGSKAVVRALLGAEAEGDLTFRHNRLGGGGLLLLNWSGRAAIMDGNHLGSDGESESSSGAWSYRARRAAHETYDDVNTLARHWARQAIELARSQLARAR